MKVSVGVFSGIFSLVLALVSPTAFAGDERIGACEWLLVAKTLSPHATNSVETQLAGAYRELYSSLVEGLGGPIQALKLEQIPASVTLSKAARKRIRRAPQPILQSIRLVNAVAESPILGEINFRVERPNAGDGSEIYIESIGISPGYPNAIELLSIERALLARVLVENPDARRITLRIAQESVTRIMRELDAFDPTYRLTPNFAAIINRGTEAREEAAPLEETPSQLTGMNVRDFLKARGGKGPSLEAIADKVAAQEEAFKKRFGRLRPHSDTNTVIRLRELLFARDGQEPSQKAKDIGAASLLKLPEFDLVSDLGFSNMLHVGLGPEINTVELVMGISKARGLLTKTSADKKRD